MSSNIFDVSLDELQGKHGKGGAPSRRSIIGDRDTVARTVRGFPEVMVKNVSTATDRANTQALVNYISQDQTQPVEDENGNVFTGAHTIGDALYDWHEIPQQSNGRREVMHLMLSMPAAMNPDHTPHEQVLIAARQFARKELSNHKYLIAQHHDTGHAHVHMLINMSPIHGRVRLNPWKPDFQRWRETFAENLRAVHVDANATPRAARGVTRRTKSQALHEIDKRHNETGTPLSKRTREAAQDARSEVSGIARDIPQDEAEAIRVRLVASKTAAESSRVRVLDEYTALATELAQGNAADKQLAGEIQQFVNQLPPVETRHDVMMKGIRAQELRANQAPEQGRAVQPKLSQEKAPKR